MFASWSFMCTSPSLSFARTSDGKGTSGRTKFSGTTGRPTVVGYTAGDVERWAGLMARSLFAAGGRAGMRVHVAYGYGLFTGGLGAHYGAERLGCTVIPVSGGQTERQVQLIREFAPDVIMVTPSYMLAIADAFRAEGADPRALMMQWVHVAAGREGSHVGECVEEAVGETAGVDIWRG